MRSRASILASPILWGLLLGAGVGVALAACASRPKTLPTAEVELRKSEIRDLWIQIRQWRVERRWSAEPASGMRVPSLKSARKCQTSKEPSTETCQDVCNLKDAICDNADSICRIADQLEGDVWAEEKCQSARASCREATAKCCECTQEEQSSAAPAPARPAP